MDDSVIASPDLTSSQMDTIKTLNFLYEKCYWISPKKSEISLTQVKIPLDYNYGGKRMLNPQRKSFFLDTLYPKNENSLVDF